MPPVIHFAKSGARNAPTLPADAVTRTFGVFGVKGSGKTTTVRVLAEGICKLGGYVVILDPVGVWWGITRAGDGPGIPGIVIGGEHGDVPLEETGGQLVAELAVARQYQVVVVDMKLLRKGAAQRFMADFLEGVYFANRRPLHVIFEEADRALPQNPRGMDPTLGRVLGAAEDIVKLGRSRGLGSTFISQRIATVTKNVVEQVEALILHAQPGPRDRKAVKEWVEANGDVAATATVMESMASLQMGEAWLYSPSWLHVLERVRVRMPRTLDSSSTPTDDEREVEEQAKRAPVDLDDLRRMMSETVERAEANDPKKLRRRIEELEQQLADAPASEPERILVPDREAIVRLTEGTGRMEALLDELREAEEQQRQREGALAERIREHEVFYEGVVADVMRLLDVVGGLPTAGTPAEKPREMPERGGSAPAARAAGRGKPAPAAPRPAPASGGGLSKGAAQLVDVLARVYPLWLTRGQLAVLAQRGKKSSTVTQQIAEAREAGAIEDDRGRLRAVVAENGHAAPTVRELREMFERVLPDGPAAIFRVLLDREEVERAELFEAAGFSATSSTPVGHLKLLTDNGLAEKSAGMLVLGPAVR